MAAQSPPLAGRVAIVTGRAIAIHLAELGARLVINYTITQRTSRHYRKRTKSDHGSGQRFRAKPGEISVRCGGEGLRVAGSYSG
ncbi:hypothetical protein DY000_02050904 [Brassica cretica]|uniref:Uncharacterized protein n=1 Tax=Brassica cretica TaxID=69181 RepID=A0ABQ7F2C9_BRACR|nr:hypothetical protein DY000_02050904 [Brassica cretica]